MTAGAEAARIRPIVLVTRPRPQAMRTARMLHQLNFRALIDPLLAIQWLGAALPGPEGVAAILLTSANAAPSLETQLHGLPLYAVGHATALAAKRRGFDLVMSADGDGMSLVELVRRTIPPDRGTLLHLSGEDVKPVVGEELLAAGYDYRRIIVYRAAPATSLAPRTQQILGEGAIDAVLFYSPRTAGVFRDLVTAAALTDRLARCTAFCLSDDIAQRIAGLSWREVAVAERRREEAMLARLETLAGQP